MKESYTELTETKERDQELGGINHHPEGMTGEEIQEHHLQQGQDQGLGVQDIPIGEGMYIWVNFFFGFFLQFYFEI